MTCCEINDDLVAMKKRLMETSTTIKIKEDGEQQEKKDESDKNYDL